jgi:hypothetical protein
MQVIRPPCPILHHQHKHALGRVPPPTGHLSSSGVVGKESEKGAPHPKQDQGGRLPRPHKAGNTQTRTWTNPVHSKARGQLEHPIDPVIDICSTKKLQPGCSPRELGNGSRHDRAGELPRAQAR